MTPSAGSTWQCLDVRHGMEASGGPSEEQDGNLSQMLKLRGDNRKETPRKAGQNLGLREGRLRKDFSLQN